MSVPEMRLARRRERTPPSDRLDFASLHGIFAQPEPSQRLRLHPEIASTGLR